MKPSEGTTVFMHNHDRQRDQDRAHPPPHNQEPHRCGAAVPAQFLDEHGFLIDQLIQFVFDTHRARHLELRIYEAE